MSSILCPDVLLNSCLDMILGAKDDKFLNSLIFNTLELKSMFFQLMLNELLCTLRA